jgi:predicted transcriptional regulator of viral defense system
MATNTKERRSRQRDTKERRSRQRDTISAEASRHHLISMIVGTYHEMPGLHLHVAEAARLFGLRPTTCRVVLDALVEDGELRRTAEGKYVSA